MKNNFKYFAFISYSRKNEKEAIWLQKKLESYRLPAVLQKQYEGLPKKLHIFRDKTDICAGDTVENALSRELQDSKNLIVLCSPDSAKSEYVHYEIQSFLSLGRSTENIFPLIIAGSPSAESEQCCFSPQLKNLNLNAADVIADGKKNAFARLLASLLGIKYDDLKRREHIRTVQRNTLFASASTIFIAFLSAFLWYITPHTRYYGDYITRWGIPEGIEETRLSSDDIKHLPEHYRIVYKCGRPIKLVHENSHLVPIAESTKYEHQNRPQQAEFYYKHSFSPFIDIQNWQLERVVCIINPNRSDSLHNHTMQIVYENGESKNTVFASFYYGADTQIPKTLSNDILSYQNIYYSDYENLLESILYGNTESSPEYKMLFDNSNICKHKIIYDENTGFDIETIFYSQNKQITADKNGIYGYKRSYTNNGLLEKESYLYENALLDSSSVSYKKLSYSDFKLTAVEFFSETLASNVSKSEPVLNKSRNFATEKISVTVSNDKIIQELSWFDEKNKPAFNKLLGSSNDIAVYNAAGDLIEITSTYENGIMFHKISYDNKNHSQKWETYENDNFYSTQIWFYDSENKLIKCEFYDKNNSLSQTIAKEYSCEKGETIKKTYFDKSERTQIEKYDIYGRHIETAISSYNANISITAKILYNGLNKSIIYYENNVPFSPVNKGFARADFTYDSRGLLQSAAFKNENGESSVHAVLQFSKYIALYTPSGLLKHEEFQDTNGNLVKPSHLKYASFKAETDFDDKFLLHGKYILPNGNTSSKRNVAYFKGHKENNKTFVVYYDISDKPLYHYVYNSDGIREYVGLYSYKENGDFIVSTNSMDKKIISSEYKDKNGKNKNRPEKDYSVFKNTYLENGEKYTDVIDENGTLKNRTFYDKDGIKIKTIVYNKDGSYIELIGNKTFSYDSSGNLISQTEQKIFEDGSYSVYFTEHKHNNSFHSILNFTKENKLKNRRCYKRYAGRRKDLRLMKYKTERKALK